MITDALIGLFVGFIGPIFNSLMPHLDMSSWTTNVDGAASTIGAYAGAASGIFPVQTLFDILGLFVVLLPALAAYVVFQWVFDHTPTVAGFGVG